MTLQEAQIKLGTMTELVVRTRSGGEYAVAWDILTELVGSDYVYGYRTNGAVRSGPFNKTETNGTIRWFHLKNVTFVTARSHLDN